MTYVRTGAPALGPRRPVEGLIARYGAWRVVVAILAAALRPRARPRGRPRGRPGPPTPLPDHLRRDIGLGPLPPVAGWRGGP